MNRVPARRPSSRRSRRSFAPAVESCEKICLLTAGVSLAGHVFADINASGARDPGEAGMPNVTLTLFDANTFDIKGVAQTDADGAYHFDDSTVDSGDMAAGSYVVAVTAPDGYTPNNPGSPDLTFVDTSASDVDFALKPNDYTPPDNPPDNTPVAVVTGFVYTDQNGNGKYDAGTDTPTAGEQVSISGGSVSAVAITNADGMFSFTTLPAGTYTITNLQTKDLSGENVTGSVALAAGGSAASGVLSGYDAIAGITVGLGDTASGFQFGEVDTAIRGQVFADATGNGLDPSDTPMGGVQIKLYRDANANGKLDSNETSVVAVTTSAPGTGAYHFYNVSPNASFIVREVVPTGYVRTAPILSDDNPVTVCLCGIAHNGVNFSNYQKPNTSALKDIKYTVTHNGCSTVVTDLRGHTDQGDTVTVTFTVKPGNTAEVSLVSYTAPGASFDANNAYLQQVFRNETGTFGPGTYSMTVLIPNSYYQVDFVGGDAIERFGPANSNIFYSAQGRLFSADNDGSKAAGVSSLSGYVYVDANKDGKRQSNEAGIANVLIQLTGTDYLGNEVNITITTAADGSYKFSGLIASNEDGYTICELPCQALAPYRDGKDTVGTLGAVLSNDEFGDIVLNVNTNGTGYNFGELRIT